MILIMPQKYGALMSVLMNTVYCQYLMKYLLSMTGIWGCVVVSFEEILQIPLYAVIYFKEVEVAGPV